MAYRGYVALNNLELVNTARTVAHLGSDLPTMDFGYFDGPDGSYLVDNTRTDITVDPDHPWVFTPNSTGMGLSPSASTYPGASEYPMSTGGGGTVIDPLWVAHPEDPTKYLLEWHPHIPIQSLAHPGLGLQDDSQTMVSRGLYTPPAGARIFGPGLFIHDDQWGDPAFCQACRNVVEYNDSWPGQKDFLDDVDYRVELAPWYSAEIPESAEFAGLWLMDLQGLDSVKVERNVTQSAGNGGVASPNRDSTRSVSFDALLFACSNAGVEHGLKWLTNQLRATTDTDNVTLKYLTASPANSRAQPATLVREAHNVVLTAAPTVTKRFNSGGRPNQHGSVYRVSWTMETLSPYSYLPGVPIDVAWDQITRQPINWIHSSDCAKPETCVDMPVLFSATCVPEEIAVVNTPPPVCGGCLPVNAIDKYSYQMPTQDYAFRGRQTAVSLAIENTGDSDLTMQVFLRVCGADTRCEDNRFPLQIAGLPPNAQLYLDGITGKCKVYYDGLWHRPVGIVGTPNGAPWRPAIIDRQTCWDFIVQAAEGAEFDISMQLYDREP